MTKTWKALADVWQTLNLSQISQIISVEKNLSCGEISDFCKESEQFMEFYRNLCRFCSKFVWRKICVEKISVEKNDKYEVCPNHFQEFDNLIRTRKNKDFL